ncbi:MAG: hypothetical protein IPK75_18645 [Acidobacteria bacterium]|nr:hypothetical protein [Acidobacteriota bacterium]
MTTDDESLLREMWCAYTLHATPMPCSVREAMAAVLAVVRENDGATIAALWKILQEIEERTRPNGDMADLAVNELARAALEGER